MAASDAAIIDYLLGLPISTADGFPIEPRCERLLFSSVPESALAGNKKETRRAEREKDQSCGGGKNCTVMSSCAENKAAPGEKCCCAPTHPPACTHSHTYNSWGCSDGCGPGASLLAGVSLENALIDPRGRPCHTPDHFSSRQ